MIDIEESYAYNFGFGYGHGIAGCHYGDKSYYVVNRNGSGIGYGYGGDGSGNGFKDFFDTPDEYGTTSERFESRDGDGEGVYFG